MWTLSIERILSKSFLFSNKKKDIKFCHQFKALRELYWKFCLFVFYLGFMGIKITSLILSRVNL